MVTWKKGLIVVLSFFIFSCAATQAMAEEISLTGVVQLEEDNAFLSAEDGGYYALSGVEFKGGEKVQLTGDLSVGESGMKTIEVIDYQLLDAESAPATETTS